MRKDWRTRRISRRYVYALGALLVLLPLVLASQAAADHITLQNPPSFTFVSDEACKSPNASLLCPDDQPGQKDLNSHSVATPSQGDLWVAWKWDITGLSGGNTGDACALFDTDSPLDGKVNSAICVTIGGDPAAQLALSPRVYTCGNGKVDRCTSTVTQVSPIHSVCGVVNNASDPFHSGQQDTQATCHVHLPDLNATVAGLVNTCSYPSEQPNSDPSDCVLIPRDAFLTIVKIADPSNQGSFPFRLNDGITNPIVFTASGSQTSTTMAIKSTATYSLKEDVPSGWAIQTGTGISPSCTGASGAGSSNGSFNNTDTITGIDANPDNSITCTFRDRLLRATVTIAKTGAGGAALSGAGFTLFNDIGTVGTYEPGTDTSTGLTCTTDASGNCSTQFTNVLPGNYCMVETSPPPGYQGGAPQCFTLTGGQTLALTFANQPQLGTINVHKQDDGSPTAAPLMGAVFTLYNDLAPVGTFTAADTSTGSTCTTNVSGDCSFTNVPLGTYCVVETTTPTGYNTAPPQCNLVIDVTAGGRTLNLTFTDPKKFKVIVLVCQKSDDSLYASKASFDGAALPAGDNTPTSVPAGINETTLCQLSGTYVHDDVTRAGNDHSATVRIP